MPSENKWPVSGSGGGAGTVVGPATSTPNAAARFSGTTGDTIKDSQVIIDDSGNIATPGTVDGRDVSTDGAALDSHIANTSNPHATTKAQVGLGNVDNTSDANKPVSTAQQTALNLKQDLSAKGVANGYASLDGSGRIPKAQLTLDAVEYVGTWNASTNTPTLANGVGDTGDIYQVAVAGTTNFGAGGITFAVGDKAVYNGSVWEKWLMTDAVTSVNGATGAVTIGTPVNTASTVVSRDSSKKFAISAIDYDATAGDPAYAEGRVFYDNVAKTLAYYNDSANVKLNIGQESYLRVTNNTGVTIPNGSVVYISGASGMLPTIALANASAVATARVAGVTTEAIANGANGYVTTYGVINSLDTSAFAAGARLFLSSTVAGAYTITAPVGPNYSSPVGYVINVNASTGQIFVDGGVKGQIGRGTANQLRGVNAAATEEENKTLSAVGALVVNNSAGSIQIADNNFGTFNNILNGDWEQSTNGVQPANWTQYNSGAATPTNFGTGGTAVPTVTLLASNSAPIRGNLSAVLTKDAVNRQGVGFSYPFLISQVDRSKKMAIRSELMTGTGTYVNGDLTWYIVDVTNSTVITPTVAAIPGITNSWTVAFDTTTSTSYRLCLHIASVSALAYSLKLDMISVDAGAISQSAALSDGILYTPTTTVTANGTISGIYARVGEYLEGEVLIAFSGSPTITTQLAWGLPTGLTVNTSKLMSGLGSRNGVGVAELFLATGYSIGIAEYEPSLPSTPFRALITLPLAASNNIGSSVTASSHGTIASGNSFTARFRVPINEWAGSGTLNMGAGAQVEYAYNTDVSSTASVTASGFASGSQGVQISPAWTSFIYYIRRVQFSSPIQSDDIISLQFATNGVWTDVDVMGYGNQKQGTGSYGMNFFAIGPNNTVDVYFGSRGPQPDSGTYGQNSSIAWAGVTNTLWRVRKVKASSPVGFGLATATDSGLISKETASAEQALGTLTWTAGTAPAGTVSQRYRWIRQGKLITLYYKIKASIAGLTVSQVAFVLPADCPVPANLSTQGTSEWVTIGSGAVLAGAGSNLTGGASCGIYKNASSVYEVRTFSGTASLSADFATGTVSYISDN